MQKQVPNKELVEVAVKNYIWGKFNNQVWQKENAHAYSYAQGYLNAICTVFGLDMVEDKEKIVIHTAVRNKIWCVVYRSDVIGNAGDNQELLGGDENELDRRR